MSLNHDCSIQCDIGIEQNPLDSVYTHAGDLSVKPMLAPPVPSGPAVMESSAPIESLGVGKGVDCFLGAEDEDCVMDVNAD